MVRCSLNKLDSLQSDQLSHKSIIVTALKVNDAIDRPIQTNALRTGNMRLIAMSSGLELHVHEINLLSDKQSF